MSFVLDASVPLAWCLDEKQSAQAAFVLDLVQREDASVPALWPLEVANGLVMAERRRRNDPARTSAFLALLASLPITVIPQPTTRIFTEALALARTHQLTVYDAAYLDLAMTLGLPLATVDDALGAAATAAGVKVLG